METIRQNIAATKDVATHISDDFSESVQKEKAESKRNAEVERLTRKTEGFVDGVAGMVADAENAVAPAWNQAKAAVNDFSESVEKEKAESKRNAEVESLKRKGGQFVDGVAGG
jgi:hypothetical protein